jgi:hypothetical protein
MPSYFFVFFSTFAGRVDKTLFVGAQEARVTYENDTTRIVGFNTRAAIMHESESNDSKHGTDDSS